MLFNEPKLLKFERRCVIRADPHGFSALQRAEIAEIVRAYHALDDAARRFSALQRAEIAEIVIADQRRFPPARVSVLFNEPKLLKCGGDGSAAAAGDGFSALQRAEIAEMQNCSTASTRRTRFQCSSTSRNC